jgi:hypothetical protein
VTSWNDIGLLVSRRLPRLKSPHGGRTLPSYVVWAKDVSALLSFRFFGTAVTGSVLMTLVAAFGPPSAQLAMLGCFISILGGLFLSFLAHVSMDPNRYEVSEPELLRGLTHF